MQIKPERKVRMESKNLENDSLKTTQAQWPFGLMHRPLEATAFLH